jgi:hypothetical protein
MNYLAALKNSTCEMAQPVKKQIVSEKCMHCSVPLKNGKGVCVQCSKMNIAYDKCEFCKIVKLTFCGCCKECLEEDDESESDYDPNECRVCGDTDNLYGRCLTCLKADERDERERRY